MPKLRKGFWIYLPVAIFAWITPFTTSVKAEPTSIVVTTTTTTTTTIAPYYNMPNNLTAIANADGSVVLNWEAPDASNLEPYIYTISFYDMDTGSESGGWGVWKYANLPTTYNLGHWMFDGSNPVTTGYGPVSFEVKAGTSGCVGEGGECLYGPGVSVDTEVLDPASNTTTTTTTSTTTTSTIAADTTSPLINTTEPVIATTPIINTPEEPTASPVDTQPLYPDTATTSTTIYSIPEEVAPNTTLPDETFPEVVVPDETFPDTTIAPDETLPFVGEIISDMVLTNILEDTFTADASTEEITAALDDILDADLSAEQFSAVMDAVLADTSDTEQVSEILIDLLSSNLSGEELTIVMDTVFSSEASVEEMSAIVENLLDSDLSAADLKAVFTTAFDDDLSDTETVALAKEILASPIDDKEFGIVINAIFDTKVSDKVLTQTFQSILTPKLSNNKFTEVVNVLEHSTISNSQVAQVVDLVISQEGGIPVSQATDLAASPKVLESIDGEQATDVFDVIVVSEVTAEDGLAISQALVDAPAEVKEAFEEELNIFEGVFDIYVPTDSAINVGVRRTFVAVTAIATILTTTTGTAPLSGGSSGGSGGSPAGGGGMPDNGKSSKIKRRKSQPRRRIK